VKLIRRAPNKGFTLLEVMIALVVMSSALILLANSWAGATLRVKKAQSSFEIASLLEAKMAETEIKYRGGSLDEIPEDPQEFDIDEKYKWRLSSKKIEFPDITSAFTQGGPVNPMIQTLVQQFTETLNKAIREVTVTIILTQDKKTFEHSAVTYFIDYNKVGGMGPGVPQAAPGGG